MYLWPKVALQFPHLQVQDDDNRNVENREHRETTHLKKKVDFRVMLDRSEDVQADVNHCGNG